MKITIQTQEIYCYTGGKIFDITLPTVVFIHGAQNDHSVWALSARYLAHRGFSVLALDLPGHGHSQGAPLATVEAMSAWLLDVLDHLNLNNDMHKTMVVGHSMGSLIALETAARSPHIHALALVGTAYPMPVSVSLLDAANHDQARAIGMVKKWSHFNPSPRMLARSQGLMERIAKRDLQNPAKSAQEDTVFYTDLAACNAYQNGGMAASAVRCPTLFLLGIQDLMTPPKAAAPLYAAIPQAQIVRIDQSGHALMAEQPALVLAHLLAFAQVLT